MSIDEGWDILLPLVYISVIYLSFISFFPSILYGFFHFFSIEAILPIDMFSPLCCSSLVSDAVLLVHFQWWAINTLLRSPSVLDHHAVLKDPLICPLEGIPPRSSKVP